MYNTLDYYKINYNKDETFQQLYNKLNNILKLSQKYSIYKNNIICIQKNIRKYLIYRFKKFTNKEDFYTLDSIYQIPLKFIHIIKDINNILYCFDIRSLYKYIQINKNDSNNEDSKSEDCESEDNENDIDDDYDIDSELKEESYIYSSEEEDK